MKDWNCVIKHFKPVIIVLKELYQMLLLFYGKTEHLHV